MPPHTPPLIPEFICTDFARSLAFYTGTLGFSVQFERAEEGFAMLERQGAHIMIDQIMPGKRSWAAGPLEHPLGRGISMQIMTTDVDGLYERVLQDNAPVFLPMEEKWYRAENTELGNRQFIVQDPDGYLLRFFQDLGRRTYLSRSIP